jgi:hypothetical protein
MEGAREHAISWRQHASTLTEEQVIQLLAESESNVARSASGAASTGVSMDESSDVYMPSSTHASSSSSSANVPGYDAACRGTR